MHGGTFTTQTGSSFATAPVVRPVRFITAIAIVAVASTCFAGFALAQPRDGILNEQKLEEAVAECNSDPACRKMLAKQKQRDAAAQAAYEAKPFHEKAIPWLIIIAAGWGIWKWAGK